MTSLSTGVLLLILALCLLVLFLVIFCFILVVRARKTAQKAKEAKEDTKEQSAAEQATEKLPSTFVQAITNLKERVTGPEYRYKVPWYVMLGPEGSGKTTLLTQSRLNALLEEDGQSFPGDTPVGWKFYGDGMVLDTAGEWTFPGNGKSSSYWKRLLRLLNQYRPERPLEGVIVTLAVTDLIGPTALDGTALSRRASILQERLQEAQEILGFRLPLYFLLTKCDHLPGFAEFARELPNERLSEIFGWSNPHTLDSLFDENWISDAFQGMRRTVEELQDQIYVQNGYSSGRQNMFILPDYLAALAKPINIFLSRVLKKADLEGAYALRGVYLTGEAGAQANVATSSKQQLLPPNHYPELSILPSMLNTWQEGNAEKVAFVHDLFVVKIFPECNLAQPVKKFFSARNKTGVLLRTTSIVTFFVLFIGTILAYTRLRQNATTLSPILKQIAADLQPKAEETYHYDPTEDFLIRLAGFKASGFRFLFLPSSWTGPLDKQIRVALVPAFRLLVLEHFRDGLA
jgi:type VI secretion system protein ImpL